MLRIDIRLYDSRSASVSNSDAVLALSHVPSNLTLKNAKKLVKRVEINLLRVAGGVRNPYQSAPCDARTCSVDGQLFVRKAVLVSD